MTYRKVKVLASVLALLTTSGYGEPSANVAAMPQITEMKTMLSALGFTATWTQTEGGQKQALENGELWLRSGNYFAVMDVRNDNESSMHRSLINNLEVCAQLGMATTAGSSQSVFSTFSQLTAEALGKPEAIAYRDQPEVRFYVLITEMIGDTTLMQCGLRRQE